MSTRFFSMGNPHQNPLPQSHLVHLIGATRDHFPNFALFLGAGASKTSGVDTAREMTDEWLNRYWQMYRDCTTNQSKTDFLRTLQWYGSGQEYSILFELLFDHQSQRRELIESKLKDASPSWGYIYLVNLIEKNVFNTVFTTNFDDLLNEACYLYSTKVRPVVCAHDSSIRSVRVSTKRPKIIKLHGDFLFDSIKNTMAELESLEQNMKDKFKQFAQEYGFIFVGYSGGDRTVMDVLDTLLRSESAFPHGVYWCIRKGEQPNDRLQSLLRFPRVKLVEINGFDELFAEINSELELPLPPTMTDPYSALAERLNSFMVRIDDTEHPVIRNDMAALGQQIKSRTEASNTPIKIENLDSIPVQIKERVVSLPLPYRFLARIEEQSGLSESAFDFYKRQLAQEPDLVTVREMSDLIAKYRMVSSANEFMSLFTKHAGLLLPTPQLSFDIALNLLRIGEYDHARSILLIGNHLQTVARNPMYYESYYQINLMQVKAHQNIELSEEEKTKLHKISEGSLLEQFGAFTLLRDQHRAQQALEKALQAGHTRQEQVQTWPIYTLFQKLPVALDSSGVVIDNPNEDAAAVKKSKPRGKGSKGNRTSNS